MNHRIISWSEPMLSLAQSQAIQQYKHCLLRQRRIVMSSTTTASSTPAAQAPPDGNGESRHVCSDTALHSTPTKAAEVIDNPCWGSPEHCSLVDLLEKIKLTIRPKQKIILYESSDFVALNKAPDLRMDGCYPATVHKLLMYLYPPPSLQQQFGVKREEETEYSLPKVGNGVDVIPIIRESLALRMGHNDLQLLNHIQQQLHQHNHVSDPKHAIRPCHQLDYATSGLLWAARTPQAAKLSTAAFEQRRVQKTYTAVVEGHVSIASAAATTTLPILPRQQVQDWLEQTEDTYRRIRGKRRPETFAGFMPPSALFSAYKSHRSKQQLSSPSKIDATRPKPKQDDRPNGKRRKFADAIEQKIALNADEWAIIWKPINDGVDEPTWDRIRRLKWKFVKTSAPQVKTYFEQASELHNQMLRDKQNEKLALHHGTACSNVLRADTTKDSIPTIFRVQEEASMGEDSFYISAPLAQTEDDFAMRVPSYFRDFVTALDAVAKVEVGEEELDYKPCLTKCTVQERVFWQGDMPATKVLLEPRTGRRHQLRVHMALAGHPILGDQTYSCNDQESSTSPGTTGSSKQVERVTCARMCLHSHKLSVELPDRTLKLEAPDPFRVNSETKTIAIDSL